MQDACNDIENNKNEENNITDIGISVDGTWQTRGYSSFDGVVTAISMDNGNVLGTDPLTALCKGCKVAENFRLSDPQKFDLWKAQHVFKKSFWFCR